MAVQASNLPPGSLIHPRAEVGTLPGFSSYILPTFGVVQKRLQKRMDKKRKQNRMEITFNYGFIELFVTNSVQKTGLY